MEFWNLDSPIISRPISRWLRTRSSSNFIYQGRLTLFSLIYHPSLQFIRDEIINSDNGLIDIGAAIIKANQDSEDAQLERNRLNEIAENMEELAEAEILYNIEDEEIEEEGQEE